MNTNTVLNISKLLQILDNETPVDKPLKTKIQMPRGVVRSAGKIKKDYNFFDVITCSNISYAIETLDLYRWILNRFYIYGPVLNYVIKSGIILISMICEALVRDALKKSNISVKPKYSKNIEKLKLILPEQNKWIIKELEVMKEIRNTQHLHCVNILEHEKYKILDWNRSIRCLHGLLGLLYEMNEKALVK
jgi:hypothetical protein